MKKEIILDLHGVVFESINQLVVQTALKKYGLFETLKIGASYALKTNRDYVSARLGPVVYECVRRAAIRPGALHALHDINRMPDINVRVCSCGAFPEYANKIENFYRNLAPVLADVKHYELLSPYDSKVRYVTDIFTGARGRPVYVVDDMLHNLEIAAILRINPVLISDNWLQWRVARDEFGAYTFYDLFEFRNFLTRQK